ncbi:MAG TPA: efflux RND transporter periplasmic adaptor subunit [Thermoanaerobaculia bacterium]|nr:efflux RND transporter periplasmic adaptor subunit [Thermoanaerobaculia bacterium]
MPEGRSGARRPRGPDGARAAAGGGRRRNGRIAGYAVPGLLLAVAAITWGVAGRAGRVADGGWARVGREDLVIGVETAGTLAAVDSVPVGPPQIDEVWEYKITFMAAEGSAVRRGQRVLAFDASELANTLRDKIAERDAADKELEKKRANLAMSRADDELHLAEAEARRRRATLKVDVPAELVSRNDLDGSRTDLALALREISYLRERLRLSGEQGRAELDTLRGKRDRAAARVAATSAAISRMAVAAPRDGTVIHVADRRGNKKKIGDSCWRGEKLIEIPDLRRMKGEAEVDEADAGRIAAGQAVALRLDAHPDITFAGRVRAAASTVQDSSPSNRQKVIKLVVELPRTDPLRMRPGMRFQGTIEVERVPGALVVPVEAVVSRADGPLVLRRSRFGSEAVRPRLGRHNDRWVEVLGGLAAGDLVALAGEPAGAEAPNTPSTSGAPAGQQGERRRPAA